MTRKTTESLSRALGRRIAQVGVAGAVAAAPLALAAPAHADTDWDQLAQCESSGDWGADTGNGFVGGLQFTPSTWRAFGGSGSAEDASRSEQIRVAERVKAAQGMHAWPTCSKKTGNTSSAPNSGSGSGSGSGSDSNSGTGSSDEDTEQAAAPAPETAPAAPDTPAAPASTHVVASGETLGDIADRYDVAGGAGALAGENGIADPDMVKTGRTLAVS